MDEDKPDPQDTHPVEVRLPGCVDCQGRSENAIGYKGMEFAEHWCEQCGHKEDAKCSEAVSGLRLEAIQCNTTEECALSREGCVSTQPELLYIELSGEHLGGFALSA